MLKSVCNKSRCLHYLILSLLLSTCLSSCYPFFKNPLPQLPDLKTDPQITGAWILTSQTGQKYYMFIFPRNTGWFDLLFFSNMDFEDSSNGNVSIMEGYSTLVNEQKFLCLRLRKRDITDPSILKGRELPYLIVNYEITDSNELNIKHFSDAKVNKLVRESKLKVETIKEEMPLGIIVDSNLVTSSSEELKEIIIQEGVDSLLATSSDEITKVYSEIGMGSFVGQDQIFVMTFKKAIIEEQK